MPVSATGGIIQPKQLPGISAIGFHFQLRTPLLAIPDSSDYLNNKGGGNHGKRIELPGF
jgi:hypothetical protein